VNEIFKNPDVKGIRRDYHVLSQLSHELVIRKLDHLSRAGIIADARQRVVSECVSVLTRKARSQHRRCISLRCLPSGIRQTTTLWRSSAQPDGRTLFLQSAKLRILSLV